MPAPCGALAVNRGISRVFEVACMDALAPPWHLNVKLITQDKTKCLPVSGLVHERGCPCIPLPHSFHRIVALE